MRDTFLLLASFVVWAVGSYASKNVDGVVRFDFDIERGNSKSEMSRDNPTVISKRNDGSLSVEIANRQTFYTIPLEIGSNQEKVSVLLDTGSSDLWVNSHDARCLSSSSSSSNGQLANIKILDSLKGSPTTDDKLSPNKTIVNDAQETAVTILVSPSEYASLLPSNFPGGPLESGGGGSGSGSGTGTSSGSGSGSGSSPSCDQYGSFNTGKSSSFRRNDSAPVFSIQYADNSQAQGIWGTDTIAFSGVKIEDMSFAVANVSSSNIGVLGIGLAELETTFAGSSSMRSAYSYQNLPIKMKDEGIIKKVAYSLYLGDIDSKSGTILFGAVDSAKYSGDLQTVPVINTYAGMLNSPLRLEVALDSFSFNGGGSNSVITNNKYPTLLDSGSTMSHMPASVVEKLGEMLSGSYSSDVGAYVVDCTSDSSYTFEFNFSGLKIKVPLTNFLFSLNSGSSTCLLGILPQNDASSMSLGDNFLRSVYTVYDLEDYEISMAQVKYTNKEDVKVISNSVPGASKAASYSATSGFASTYDEGSAKTTIQYSTGTLTNSGAALGIGSVATGGSPTGGSSDGGHSGSKQGAATHLYSISIFSILMTVFGSTFIFL